MGDMVQIARDPFARTTLLRECVETAPGKTCDWCDQPRRSGRLFAYSTEQDGIRTRPERIKGLFCSAECMRAYHH